MLSLFPRLAGAAGACVLATLSLWALPVEAQRHVLEWEHLIRTPLNERPEVLAADAEGGYLVAGSVRDDTASYSTPPTFAFWVARIRPDGTLDWKRPLPLAPDVWGEVGALIPESDGGMTLFRSGTVDFVSHTQAVMSRLDASGEERWQHRFGPGVACTGSSCIAEFIDAIPTHDGGYLAAGSLFGPGMEIPGRYDTSRDGWLVKFTAAGEVAWQQAYGGNGFGFIHAVVQMADGGYAFAGYNGIASREPGFWVARVDEAGALLWERALYLDDTVEGALTLAETDDGGLLAGGDCQRRLCLVRLTPQGDTAWIHQSEEQVAWLKAMRIVPLSAGRYAVLGDRAGASDLPAAAPWLPQSDAWVFIINEAGLVEQQQTAGASGSPTDLVVAPDGGFVVLNQVKTRLTYDTYGSNWRYDAWLGKLYPDFSDVAVEDLPERAPSEAIEVHVWPNPIRQHGTVAVRLPGAGTVDLAVYDMLGRRVLEMGRRSGLGTMDVRIEASALPAGVYLLRAQGEQGGSAGRRFVVQ